jgi:hypothetical protein
LNSPIRPRMPASSSVPYRGHFQDLIILFWDEKQQPEEDFWDFANLVSESRYYSYYDHTVNQTVTTLTIVDGITLAESLIREWAQIPKWAPRVREDNTQVPLTIYLGFQRDWYTRDDFFAILEWSKNLYNITGFDVEVEWLPNDWFDHLGMVPTLTDGENALEWMEQQNQHYKPEKIHYNFKGEHYGPS